MQEEATMLSLKWDSFSSQMTNSLDACYEKQYFVDLSLVCKNGTILKCHKMVLANASSFFRRLLVKNEHPHPMIILHDIEADDLKTVVNFMYSGEIQVAKSKVRKILKIGEILEVSGLKDMRSTILATENEKMRHENLPGATNAESPLKIVDSWSIVNSAQGETSVPTSARRETRMISNLRNSGLRNNECEQDIENNEKYRTIFSKKHENKVESSERTVDLLNAKVEGLGKNGRPSKKRVNQEEEINWATVLTQISTENEGLPLKKLCILDEVEITACKSMEEPPFDRASEDTNSVNSLPMLEHFVNYGVRIKDEVDCGNCDSDCDSNVSAMENDDPRLERGRLPSNSAIEIFGKRDLLKSVNKKGSSG